MPIWWNFISVEFTCFHVEADSFFYWDDLAWVLLRLFRFITEKSFNFIKEASLLLFLFSFSYSFFLNFLKLCNLRWIRLNFDTHNFRISLIPKEQPDKPLRVLKNIKSRSDHFIILIKPIIKLNLKHKSNSLHIIKP